MRVPVTPHKIQTEFHYCGGFCKSGVNFDMWRYCVCVV